MNKDVLPLWNARKLREAAVPLRGKPLRDVRNYIHALMGKDRLPDTAFGFAFFKAALADKSKY